MKRKVAGGCLYDTKGETHLFIASGLEEQHGVIS